MTTPAATSYDEVRYPSIALPQTHPNRLATLAALFGLHPAPVDRCRVLEIGCGDGANLLPMAFALRESTFVGIDLAADPIAVAREQADALGLENVSFRQLDLMALAPEAGRFDYVIAHGFYSWVPPAVRDRLLAVCRAHLAPQGVAYVSYNTLPGGHLRRMTREMMLFHVQNIADPMQRVQQARAFLRWLQDGQPEPSFYEALLEKEEDLTQQYSDEHLYHDHLAEINDPVYFHQFAGHAARHGLQYLAEADFSAMQERAFPPDVAEMLRRLDGDPVLKEQYMDFLRCRMFRQTLLCHAEVPVVRPPDPAPVRAFYAGAPVRRLTPEPSTAGAQPAPVSFEGHRGRVLRTTHPLTRAVFEQLEARWPAYVPFDALQAAVAREEDAHLLEALLLGLYADGFIVLQCHAPHVATEASARPEASPVARLQAENGGFVTSLHHEAVRLEQPRERRLLALLDGTRDRDALRAAWSAGAETGEASPTGAELEEMLQAFARQALLIA